MSLEEKKSSKDFGFRILSLWAATASAGPVDGAESLEFGGVTDPEQFTVKRGLGVLHVTFSEVASASYVLSLKKQHSWNNTDGNSLFWTILD